MEKVTGIERLNIHKYFQAFCVAKLFAGVLLLTAANVTHAELLEKVDSPKAPKTGVTFPLVQNNQPSTSDRKLADYLGRVVLVDFWASWCGPCRDSFPWMNKLQDKYAAEEFAIVAINVDTDPKFAYQFLNTFPAEFDVLLDNNAMLQEAFNVLGMPTSFLLDRDGKVRTTHVGFNNSKTDSYEKDIIALLNEE